MRICEAGLAPSLSAARLEIELLNPNGTIESALQMQAYRNTYYALRHARSADQKPTGPMADLVEEHDFMIENEEFEKRLA